MANLNNIEEFNLNVAMKGCIRKYEMNSAKKEEDLFGLYIELETMYKASNLNGKTFELTVEADDGSNFLFTFEEGQTLLSIEKDGETKEVIRKGDKNVSAVKERMKTVAEQLKLDSISFGAQPPQEFIELLANRKEGDVLTFASGVSLTIEKNENGQITYLPLKQKVTEDIVLGNFLLDEANSRVIDLFDDKAIRELFKEIKGDKSERATYRSTDVLNATRDISLITKRIKPNEVYKFNIGEESIIATNDGNKTTFIDKEGYPISNSTLTRFVAWAQTAPTEINVYEPSEPTYFDIGLAQEISNQISEQFINRDYISIYTTMREYVENYGSFSLDISTLTQKDEALAYAKNSIVAYEEKGSLNINLITKVGDETKIEKIDATNFDKVCEKLHHTNMEMLPKFKQKLVRKELQKVSEQVKGTFNKSVNGDFFKEVKEKVDEKVDKIINNANQGIAVKMSDDRDSLLTLARAFAVDVAVEDKERQEKAHNKETTNKDSVEIDENSL